MLSRPERMLKLLRTREKLVLVRLMSTATANTFRRTARETLRTPMLCLVSRSVIVVMTLEWLVFRMETTVCLADPALLSTRLL